MKNIGTPKTLDEAISNALMHPLKDVREQLYFHIKDFLAQKFGVVIIDNKEQDVMLMDLYENLIHRSCRGVIIEEKK